MVSREIRYNIDPDNKTKFIEDYGREFLQQVAMIALMRKEQTDVSRRIVATPGDRAYLYNLFIKHKIMTRSTKHLNVSINNISSAVVGKYFLRILCQNGSGKILLLMDITDELKNKLFN